MSADQSGRVLSPLPVRQILYRGKQIGTVAHLIVVAMPAGADPAPGVGWHTLCSTRWADGTRTAPDAWGFGRQGDLPLCRKCEKGADRA